MLLRQMLIILYKICYYKHLIMISITLFKDEDETEKPHNVSIMNSKHTSYTEVSRVLVQTSYNRLLSNRLSLFAKPINILRTKCVLYNNKKSINLLPLLANMGLYKIYCLIFMYVMIFSVSVCKYCYNIFSRVLKSWSKYYSTCQIISNYKKKKHKKKEWENYLIDDRSRVHKLSFFFYFVKMLETVLTCTHNLEDNISYISYKFWLIWWF